MDAGPNVPVWEDGDPLDLAPLRGDIETDVCVIGLGGSGLACLSELLAVGVSAVGLDGGMVAGGASGRNGGFLRSGLAVFHHEAVRRYGRDRAARLYRLTMVERDRMCGETPASVRRLGYLRRATGRDEARDCRAHLRALHADDLPGEWYEGDAGCGVLIRDDAACNPLARCRALARRLRLAGARLFERSPVEAIAGEQVLTTEGRVRTRAVVVAVDGGLTALLPELSADVRPVRLQMLATAPVAGRVSPFAVGSRRGWDYWQQAPSGSIALGGCRDAALEEEWTSSAVPTAAVQRALDERLRADIGADAAVTHRWAATVTYTDSGLPVLREVRPRVWAVGAYSGTGNLVGGVAARAAAHLALGSTTVNPFA
jgi:glycine/D-amino acid oxidase-like deaminating enzyme